MYLINIRICLELKPWQTLANSNYITKTKIKNIKNPRIEDEGHNMQCIMKIS